MNERAPGDIQSVEDALRLCFSGVEFEPLPVDMQSDGVVSGSIRMRFSYDAYAGCGVEVIEFMGLAVNEDRAVDEVHCLIVIWDNGLAHELDLDDDIILFPDDYDWQPDGEAVARFQIDQALRAAME